MLGDVEIPNFDAVISDKSAAWRSLFRAMINRAMGPRACRPTGWRAGEPVTLAILARDRVDPRWHLKIDDVALRDAVRPHIRGDIVNHAGEDGVLVLAPVQ